MSWEMFIPGALFLAVLAVILAPHVRRLAQRHSVGTTRRDLARAATVARQRRAERSD